MSTQQERDGFLWMQGRMVELLLRYDITRFTATFAELSAATASPEDEALNRLRELAVVIYLREELFEQILPRIKRRLSFAAPRTILVEEMPARGRIDWPRTMAASWRDLPEEPPLEVHTRQRRRNFATPENLLTVVTILEYQAFAQRLLDREEDRDPLSALQHPLYDIVDVCSRELIFPQFAGLEREARGYVEAQDEQTVAELELLVAESAQPGQNSAYDELLIWRARLRDLRLLQRDQTVTPSAMLGADPRRDNYLYQLWIFFELADLLRAAGCCGPADLALKPLSLRFRWEGCGYELRHDQGVREPVATWGDPDGKHAPPGVRPDFYLRRIDPPPVRVQEAGREIWREPGVVWDAKYYRERDSDDAPASPVKRMIADLSLLGESYGVLLFAYLREGAQDQGGYVLRPDPIQGQSLLPDQRVTVMRLPPTYAAEGGKLRAILLGLISYAHKRLGTAAEIRCHGVFLDALSVTAHGALAGITALRRRDGAELVPAATPAEHALDTLLLCPKPHIGPWRMDVVSLEHDCCKNARVCHLLGSGVTTLKAPSRLSRLEDIAEAIRTTGGDDDAARTEAATKQVRVIAQRYADLIKPNLPELTDWVRRQLAIDPLFEMFPHLTAEHRSTLGLARFLWLQIEQIRAENYAGPALLFTGVLEELTRATVYARSPVLRDQNGRELNRTLGTLGNRRNWPTVRRALDAGNYWHAQLTPRTTLRFEEWADKLWHIAQVRNRAAHEAHVTQAEFLGLERLYFGSLSEGYGALNGLMLAWREPSP